VISRYLITCLLLVMQSPLSTSQFAIGTQRCGGNCRNNQRSCAARCCRDAAWTTCDGSSLSYFLATACLCISPGTYPTLLCRVEDRPYPTFTVHLFYSGSRQSEISYVSCILLPLLRYGTGLSSLDSWTPRILSISVGTSPEECIRISLKYTIQAKTTGF
jgi:hypothetical protein